MKLHKNIVKGTNPPKHLLVAYGRNIFQLFHVQRQFRKDRGIYLRDLPLGILDLMRDYKRPEAWEAYTAECDRVGIPDNERIGS